MKKIVSILLIFSVIIALCLNVSAASVYDVGSFTKTSYLSITNGQATCKSSYSESNGNTASVKITQSLENILFYGSGIQSAENGLQILKKVQFRLRTIKAVLQAVHIV